ncbi:TPA_asm: P [Argyranthemum gammacytorhabdovirus 1]|nr:TPA_asm: P [Argyranthemum gammacytorhabdovirus 1]
MTKEAESAKKVQEQIQKNIKLVTKKGDHSLFAGLPNLSVDPTSPLTSGSSVAASIAQSITGKAANMEGSQSEPLKEVRKISREEIEKEAHSVSIALGIVLDPAYVEDMYELASRDSADFSKRDIYFYLRGAAKAHHVSVTNKLNELMQSVNMVLNKNRNTMQSYTDTSKAMMEKLSVIEFHMGTITPSISSTMAIEHENTRKAIKALTVAPSAKASSSSSKPPVIVPPTTTHPYPDSAELIEMCKKLNIPNNLAEKCATDYQGIITWEEYRGVNEGTIDAKQFKKLVMEWKKKSQVA